MRTVALLTDFGLSSTYVGIIKGVITKINPTARLIDLTHQVTAYDIKEGAFLLKNAVRFFPKGTIFLAVVDPGVGTKRKILTLETKNYLFVGPDNGLLYPAAKKDRIKKAIAVTNKKYFLKNPSTTFEARDKFSPVAAYLSKDFSLDKMGKRLKAIKKLKLSNYRQSRDKLGVGILHIDSFGNIVTGIKADDFKSFIKLKPFKANLNNKEINKFYKTYSQAKIKEPFFIQGSSGYLEISLKQESAGNFFNIEDKNKYKILIKKRFR